MKVIAKSRTKVGKGAMRRLRRTGQIPAVVYGGDNEPLSIELRHDDIWHSLENEAFASSILNLELDGKSEKVILRAVHRHPAKPSILHADFQRVSSKSELTMSVPVHYLNAEDAPGIKAGGMLDISFTELAVRCLAKDLPEAIEVDVGEMEIGDSATFTSVKFPKGVMLSLFVGMTEEEISAHDQTIVAVHETKVVEEAEIIEAESVDGEETTTDQAAESSDKTE